MAGYHKFVFDPVKREFVGEFERMYELDKLGEFDSWGQDDVSRMDLTICLQMIRHYEFSKILDLGCGEGTLTSYLKKNNNHVLGVDVAPTAVEIARSRYPDVQFEACDINDKNFMVFLDDEYGLLSNGGGIDLVFASQTFSYLSNWKMLVNDLSKRARHLLISLYLPEEPMGFVKSSDDLMSEICAHFNLLEVVNLKVARHNILFCENKNLGA